MIQSKNSFKKTKKHLSKVSTNLYLSAIKRENKVLIEWLISIGCPHDSSVTNFALKEGKIKLFKWLVNVKKFSINCDTKCIAVTISTDDNFDIVKYFKDELTKGKNWDVSPSRTAIEEGKLEILKYLEKTRVKSTHILDDTYLWSIAARHGRIEIMKWLQVSGGYRIVDYQPVGEAVKAGQLEALRWLICEQKCFFNERDTMSKAAEGGHLACMKFLREERVGGCAWDAATTSLAAKHGKLDCLKYAVDNGCQWMREDILRHAEHTGNVELLSWFIFDQGGKIRECTCEIVVVKGHLEMLKFIIENDLFNLTDGEQLRDFFKRLHKLAADSHDEMKTVEYLSEKI